MQSKACDWLITGIRKEFTSKIHNKRSHVESAKQRRFHTKVAWAGGAKFALAWAGGAKFALAWASAKIVSQLDAVVFRRPYLPHFSSKSYTV